MHHEIFRFVQPRRADEYVIDIATILATEEEQQLAPLAPLFQSPPPTAGGQLLRSLVAGRPGLTQADLDASAVGRATSGSGQRRSTEGSTAGDLGEALETLPDDLGDEPSRLAWTWTVLAAIERLGLKPDTVGVKAAPDGQGLLRAVRLARLHRLRAASEVEFKRPGTIERLARAAVAPPRAWRVATSALDRQVTAVEVDTDYDPNFQAAQPAVNSPKTRAALHAALLRDYRTIDGLIDKAKREAQTLGLQRQAQALQASPNPRPGAVRTDSAPADAEGATDLPRGGAARDAPSARSGVAGADARPAPPAAVETAEVWAALAPRLDARETTLLAKLSPAPAPSTRKVRGAVTAGASMELLDTARLAIGQQLNTLGALTEAPRWGGELAIAHTIYGQDGAPSVKSLGFGDLIIARERLVGYDADEISAIINSAGNESLKRTHRHLTQSVTTVETESFERTSSLNELRESTRFDLQTQASKALQEEFGLQAGVKASGKYGVTQVDAFVAGQFSRSSSEAQSEASSFAKEVVNRTVNEIERSTRKLTRQTVTETSEEINKHTFADGGGQSRSNIYLHVDRITECELRHYATRLFLQFCIWEPSIGLTGPRTTAAEAEKAPEFDLASAAEVDETNYLAKAAKWGASVQPPPPRHQVVTASWVTSPAADDENTPAGDVKTLSVAVPAGYQPWRGKFTVTGIDRWRFAFFGLSIAGVDVFDWSISGGVGHNCDIWLTPWCGATDDFDISGNLEMAMRIKDHGDHTATFTVQLVCDRGHRVFREWQIATYAKLKEAYDRRVAEVNQRAVEQRMRGLPIGGRSPAANAKLVRNELIKWSIKALRQQPFNFDGLEDVIIGGVASQEPSPAYAGHYSELAEFYMKSFEWEQGTYFNYPYFFGARSDYERKLAVQEPDFQFEEFLQAGMTMFNVPVTPGMEERVLHFLSSTDPEDAKIRWTPTGTVPADGQMSHLYELWQEVLIRKQRDLVMGSGTLSVTTGATTVVVNPDSAWTLEPIDVGREVVIEGDQYAIAALVPGQPGQFELDRPYARATKAEARYLTGSVPFGQPWQIRYPTSLVVLNDQRSELP